MRDTTFEKAIFEYLKDNLEIRISSERDYEGYEEIEVKLFLNDPSADPIYVDPMTEISSDFIRLRIPR